MPTPGGARRAAKRVPLHTFPKDPVVITVTDDKEESAQPVGNPWQYELVQRMIPRTKPMGHGVDRHFTMDYMGSLEFESGALPACVKRIREADSLGIVTAELQYLGKTRTVYFIGSADSMDQRILDMQVWLDEGVLSKEYTEFEFHFCGNYREWGAKYKTSRAWLSLRNNVFFTLEERYARQILDGLNNPPPKTA